MLQVQLHLRRGEHQKIAEQLVGQLLQLPGLIPAGAEIALHLLLILILLPLQQIQIAHQRGERRADVMGDGGDEAAVGRQGVLFPLHPLDDGAAHLLHRPGQVADLVIPVTADLVVAAALGHPLDLLGQADNGARNVPVVQNIHQQQGQTGQRQRQDDHQVIIGHLRKIHHRHPKHAVGKLQPVVAVLVGDQLAGAGAVFRRLQVVGIIRGFGQVGLIAVGLQNGLFTLIQRQVHIFLGTCPGLQRLSVRRRQAVGLNIAVQVPDVLQLPPVAGLGAEIPFLYEPAACHDPHQKDAQRQAQGDQLHHQQLGVQAQAVLTLHPADTPFPTQCGSVWGRYGPPPAFSAGSECAP